MSTQVTSEHSHHVSLGNGLNEALHALVERRSSLAHNRDQMHNKSETAQRQPH